MSFIDSLWYKKHNILCCAVAFPLIPLSWVFKTVTSIRRSMYANGKLFSDAPLVPVVVVGGINVGGSGKTPACIAILKELVKRGYHPGLISRGYKGESKTYPYIVTMDSDPKICGDEPLLIKQSLQDNVIVAVDPDRVRGAFELAKQGVDIIVTDDGLQHYALDRDVEIIVVDSKRMFGNGHVMPAGPLREGIWRTTTVDAVLVNGTPLVTNNYFSMLLKPSAPHLIDRKSTQTLQRGTEICAMAGIGDPNRFYKTLTEAGFIIKDTINVPDHGVVDKHVLLEKTQSIPVVMTAKDAVKYQALTIENLFVLDVEAQIGPRFFETIFAKINSSTNKINLRRQKQERRKKAENNTSK